MPPAAADLTGRLSQLIAFARVLTADESTAASLLVGSFRHDWTDDQIKAEIVRWFLRCSQPVDGMPARMRAVLVLRHFEGLSDNEIAERLRLSRGAVRAQAGRGLAALREQALDEQIFAAQRWVAPVRPDVAARVASAAARRHRWRRIRAGIAVTVVALGAISTAIIVIGRDAGDEPTGTPTGFLNQPQATGAIPEPAIRTISELTALPDALPGATVTEPGLPAASMPLAVDGSGGVVVQIGEQLAVLGPGETVPTPVADLARPVVVSAAADENALVWVEADNDIRDQARQARATVDAYCVDRRSETVEALMLPAEGPTGSTYDNRSDVLAVGPGGIAVARLDVGRMSRGSLFSEAADIYVAARCGEPLSLVQESAGAPQVVGDWLYYQHSGGIWRSDLRADPVLITEPADAFRATADALVWTTPAGQDGATRTSMIVARPDGSHQRSVPVDAGWSLPYVATATAVSGVIQAEDGTFTGTWIYQPSRAAIVTLDTAGRNLSIIHGSGDTILASEWVGSELLRSWLVTLP